MHIFLIFLYIVRVCNNRLVIGYAIDRLYTRPTCIAYNMHIITMCLLASDGSRAAASPTAHKYRRSALDVMRN